MNPSKTWDRKDPWFWKDALEQAQKDGVELEKAAKVVREGNKVRVYMTAVAPAFSIPQFEVNQGDEVTVYVTNVETIEDLTHGFTLEGYGIAHGDWPASYIFCNLQGCPSRRTLVLLPMVLPRIAHGNVRSNDC